MDSSPSPSAKSSKAPLWIALGALLCVGLLGSVIALVIAVPTVAKVRGQAQRTADSSSLRQVVQASLIWAAAHGGQLPPVKLTSDGRPLGKANATIHSVAAALARDGGLNEAALWFVAADTGRAATDVDPESLGEILDSEHRTIGSAFTRQQVFAWDFVTGLTTDMPATTPMAWTRGLRIDGTWDPTSGVYGGDGGYIAFLGGNVRHYHELKTTPLHRADGIRTSNILETLPAGVRVVGSGPGSLHGSMGIASD